MILLLAFSLLFLLLYFRKRQNRRAIIVTKTALSLLFVCVAIRYPSPMPWYYACILSGLVLSMLGDVMLALVSTRAFRAGLVFFLLGHVSYALGFFSIGIADYRLPLGAIPVVLAGVFFYRFLKPHLGAMRIPVAAYMLCISVMVMGALTVFLSTEWLPRGRVMVFGGAILFYLSDCLVARNRFVVKHYLNRLIGLPMYYCAQFLIAFSLTEL